MIRSPGRRILAFGVLPLLFLAGTALPGPLLGDRLPDPLASHWNLDAVVDGTLARAALWPGLAVVLVLGWAALAVRVRGRATRLPEAVPALALGGFAAGVAGVLTAANLDAASAEDAARPSVLLVLAPVAAGALAGLAGWWAERGRPWTLEPAPAPGPGLGGSDAHRAVWAGHGSGRTVHVAGALVAAGTAGVALVTGLWGVLAVAAVAGATAFTLGSVQVVAGPRGLTVRLSPLAVPVKSIAAADIASAEAAEIHPARWGGYGWRFGGTGASAVVLRRGPGLVVHGRDGRRFAVTVDDPEAGAAVLNAVVRGRPTPV